MQNIYQILDDLGILYKKHEHRAIFTCEEAEEVYADIPGGHSKNLFIRNKKGSRHYLVIIESHKTVDLDSLRETLNESKLGFASPERLRKYLDVTPGSVTPFGLIYDTEKAVTVIVDSDLMKHNILHYHPGVNTATLEIARDDFKSFLDWTGNTVRFVAL